MTQTLRDFATQQLDAVVGEYGPPCDRDGAIERWMRHLASTGQVPDDILEAMPEVSRGNDPQVSPQEYECGCVAVVRVTDRDGRTWLGYNEKPFEMRLAIPCNKGTCELAHLRTSLDHEIVPKFNGFEFSHFEGSPWHDEGKSYKAVEDVFHHSQDKRKA
jgi:hypothetical protein